MTISFSYSLLDAEDSCPEKARRLFVTRDYKRAWTAAKDGGIDVHAALEARLKGKTPLPPQAQSYEPLVASIERRGSVETELPLAVDHQMRPTGFWEGSPFLRGKYDAVVRRPPLALIVDWKTGRSDFEKELQLEIGALLLFANDPAIETIAGMNVYLKTGKAGRIYEFQRAEISPRWAKLIHRMRKIEERDSAQKWEKRPGPLCGWCPVKDCEHYRGG